MNRVERMKIKSFIASILLVIISLYYASSTMFGHTHIIEGATITHSHFHSCNHANNDAEGHTSDELALIEQLTLVAMWMGEELIFELEAPQCYRHFAHATNLRCAQDDIPRYCPARAPPIM